MKLSSLLFALFTLLSGVSTVYAQDPGQWYQAEIAVPDQSDEQRQEAVAEALNEVLVKVSGRGDIAGDAALTGVLGNPTRYVQTFSYRTNEDSANAQELPLILWVKFDPRGVEQLLKSAGIPVWGGVRPNLLIWLAVEQGGRRQLVGDGDSGLAHENMVRQAEKRALPIRFPLLDLEDKRQVDVADVWGDFHEAVLAASQRYGVRAVLIGKLYQLADGSWRARWSLSIDGERMHWEDQAKSATEVLAAGVDGSADRLASRYVTSYTRGGGEALFVVHAVDKLADYHRVIDYLLALHGITAVTPVAVNADEVRLLVVSDGALDQLRKTIGLGSVLRPEEPPLAVPGPAPDGAGDMPLEMPVATVRQMAFRLLP